MWYTRALTSALLAATASAQFATYSDSGRAISVNIPSGTASSKSGPIYFQISAPSGTQWLGFGQGSRMSGATMFLVYSSGSNVVLSPRKGTGHVMPQYSSDIQVTLLSGSGIQSDGSLVANVRCDNCLDNMDPTSTSSDWIMAHKDGNALNSNDQSATISQHDSHSNFNLDLTTGTGGSSQNPFVAAAVSSSAGPTESATATGESTSSATGSAGATSSVSAPIASSNPQSGSSSSNSDSDSDSGSSHSPSESPYIHGVLMSILFVGLFPLFALTLYLPTTKKVRFIHAPLQALSVILLIVGMALGIIYGSKIDELDGYHQVIGFIVVALLVVIQPALGIYQHLHYSKTGGRSPAGPAHQWLGRGAIALGIVNGGLGWHLTETTSAYAPYAAVAAVMAVIYIGVVVFGTIQARRKSGYPHNKEDINTNGYEMRSSKEARTASAEYR